MRVVAIGSSPSSDPASVRFRLLLRQLHLRSDTQVQVLWLESGEARHDWQTYASRQLVHDDLRTWLPARAMESFAPSVAARLRGLRARVQQRHLDPCDVLLLQDGKGEHAVRMPGPKVRVAVALGPDPIEMGSMPASIDLILADWERAGGTEDPRLMVVPVPFDGRQARAWAIERMEELRTSDSTEPVHIDLPIADVNGEPDLRTVACSDVVLARQPATPDDARLLVALLAGCTVVSVDGAADDHPARDLMVQIEGSSLDARLTDLLASAVRDRPRRMAEARSELDVWPVSNEVHARLTLLLGGARRVAD